MSDHDSRKEKQSVDYTGVRIGAMLLPVFFLIAFMSNADAALAIGIVSAVIIVAIKIRWHLRKHLWFWAVITIILTLHVPLVLRFRLPQGNMPTLFYTMPIAIADFLIISVALGVAEKLLSKGSSSTDAEE